MMVERWQSSDELGIGASKKDNLQFLKLCDTIKRSQK
jgi:hypothetical protein